MRAALILNQHSRRGRECANDVRAALGSAGVAYVEVQDSAAIPTGVDSIIGAGGDGTITACVAIAVDRSIPLGIIALGTFNELARTLNVPLDIEDAVRAIAVGRERAIDVGCVNGKYFVNEASIGISSRITRMQTPELKQRFGVLAIIGTAVQSFRHAQPMHVTLRHDGAVEQLHTIQLTVANSHRFGGVLEVADAAIDDGWLDLYSVDIRSAREGFAVALAMFSGKRHAVPGLRTLRAKEFEVLTRRPHHIVADAEPAGSTPARFGILPKALRVFVSE